MAGNIRHIELWKRLEEKAREATKTRKLTEETLEAAEKLIDEAKAVDANVTDVVAILSEATTALSDKDYKLAFEKANECKEKVLRVYRERIRSILDSSRFLLDLVKSVGGDTASEESSIKQAEESFQKDDFAKAVELAKESWKRSEKTLHEHLSKMFSTAQALIMTAKNSGKDVKMAEELLARARETMESSDYEMAISSTKECLDTVGSTLKNDVLVHMDESKALMDLAREVGYDVKRLESSINKVDTEMEKYSFDKALHYAKQTKSDAEKTLKKALSDRLDVFSDKLREAEKMNANVVDAKGTINEAKEALDKGNFQRAVTLIKESDEAIDNAKFELVLETVAESREKFIVATNVGADISKSMELLEKARESLKKKRFEEALRLAKKSDDEIVKIIKEFEEFEKDMRNIQNSFEIAADIGADIEALKSDFEKAQEALQDRNFEKAVGYVNGLKTGIKNALSKKTHERIGRAKSIIDLGEKMGVELAEVKEILEKSIKHVNAREYKEAVEVSNEARTKSEGKIKEHLKGSLTVLKDSIDAFISDKDIAKLLNDLLAKSQASLDASEFEKAYNFIEDCTKDLGTKAFGEVKNRLVEIESAVGIASELDIEVAVHSEKVALAKKALDEDRFRDVMLIGLEISNYLKSQMDKVFENLKGRLIELKKMKIDIGGLVAVLKEAAVHKKEDALLATYQKLHETDKKASAILKNREKAYEIISSTAVMIAEARKEKIDVRSILTKFLDAKKLYEAHDFEKSLELAEETKVETKNLVDQFNAAQKILNIKQYIPVAQQMNIDIKEFSSNLVKSIEAIKNKDYAAALQLSESTNHKLMDVLKNELSTSLSALQSLISEAKEIGINVKIAEEQFLKSKQYLAKQEYKESAEFSISARNEIKRLKDLSKKAAGMIKKAQDLINESESMNVPVPKQKALIKDSIESLDKHDYEGALKLAERTLAEVERERDNFVAITITNFEETVKRAKKDGINTTSSEKLLERAVKAFEAKRYKEALELAMQSESEIERVSLQQDMAQKALNTARRKIDSIQVPAPISEDLLKKGQDAFDNGEYVKALEYAIQSGDEIYKVMGLYDDAMGRLQNATKLINVMYKMGIKAQGAEKWLKKANSSLASGAFEEASEFAEKSVENAKKFATDHLKSMVKQFESTLVFAKDQGIEVEEFDQKSAEVKGLLGEENFESANILLENGKMELDSLVTKKMNDLIDDAEAQISHAKKMGADTSESEKLLEDAVKALAQTDFDKVLKLLTESEKKVESRKKLDKKFIDLTYQTDSMISKSKKFGLDVKEAEKMLVEALKLRDVDMEMAMSIAEKSHKLANKAMDEFAPVLDGLLSVKEPKLNAWVDGEITVTNNGKALARDVKIEILGDADVKKIDPVPTLKAGGSVTVPIRIKLITSGSVPLGINLSASRLLDEKVYRLEKLETIEVPSKPGEKDEMKKLVAKKEYKCNLCHGTIKKGLPIIVCFCGKVYHEPCAKRTGKCSSCNVEFDLEN